MRLIDKLQSIGPEDLERDALEFFGANLSWDREHVRAGDDVVKTPIVMGIARRVLAAAENPVQTESRRIRIEDL